MKHLRAVSISAARVVPELGLAQRTDAVVCGRVAAGYLFGGLLHLPHNHINAHHLLASRRRHNCMNSGVPTSLSFNPPQNMLGSGTRLERGLLAPVVKRGEASALSAQ